MKVPDQNDGDGEIDLGITEKLKVKLDAQDCCKECKTHYYGDEE
jgi:hypothetical protein